ncbi:ankyrin repeat and fibronectin type-III domain-containing protein 1 isoform X2 [Sipha flava]|uniref:Ankyrin repeat and fibronectin type-III domain-containing protein 1 isoform X2 n=2 Tax=Sipha flava TaxID=143950 RepID=A0A8B8FZ46_9HEMI|nr:ankyrin repeat and fibronectin type-III domain-containing protein 1 isoform X2 [Sipha flava]
MADFERLIPADSEDGVRPAVSRSSSFSRMSLARFSQRLRRRGGTVGADEQDKENAHVTGHSRDQHVVGKRVKFDKRVYHGPVAPLFDRSGGVPYAAVRGILKTSSGRAERCGTAAGTAGYSNRGYDDTVPNRMRMYDVPVTSFYIGANDHLHLPPAVKRSSSVAASAVAAPWPESCKRTRRFGTEIGTSISSLRNNSSSSETQTKQRQHHLKARESQVHNINIHLHGLFAAVEHGQLEKAKNILSTCEVQVNSVNSDGLTPLDVAFLSNNRELVRLLLIHGATEETSMKNLEPHLMNLLGEAERRVLELRLCGNQDSVQTKSLVLWERRKRGLKKMLIGFEHAKPPDKPEKIIVEVTGNDSVRVSCVEADNQESAICTKFNVEWSTSESFKNLTGSKCVPATDGEITISNLEHGKTYYFRCSAGNLRAFSDFQYPTPAFVTISSWWDVSQESRRCSAAIKVKMDDILDKMISIRPDLHRSLFEVSGNDCTLNTKRRKPPTFKQLFSGNTKLHKNLRRGVYLSCLLYHEDKVLVTNEDYLPVVEIDDTYPKEMLNDFHWFYKIAFAWKDLKWFKEELEKSTNSSISFRTKLIQAVTQMQDIFNTQDLGKVYYKPIRDSDGTTVICTVNNVCQPKNVVNLKWTPIAKIKKKSSRSDNLTDLLISSIQDQIMFYQTSYTKLQKGLYVGYLLMRSSVDMLHVMVPMQNPNMPVCCKIRDNSHINAEEWLWLQQGAGAPSEYKCLGFASQFKVATNQLFSLVQIPKDKRTVQRVYTSEVIEVNQDVSIIMIVPPAEVACAVGEGNQSPVNLHRIKLIPLSVQVFEMIHFGTYRADTLLLYARLSSVVQLDSDDARYSIRQAWSSSDLEVAKQRLDSVEALETSLNAAWKHLRWLLDVMNFARERLFQSQISNSNCSKSASNSQLEMKSAKSNSLLQLPDTKLVKSRGSWPGPGLNSMRTLESVCPEISRSEQYLSPPAHDRDYGLTNKKSCSSETSNDSKDEPEYNDAQSSDPDLSSRIPNHVSTKDLIKVDDERFSDATIKSESLVPVPAPGIIEVCAAYETGLPHPPSLKLHISPMTSAREVVQLFLQQLNMSVVVKGKSGPIYPSSEFGNFCLVSVTGARERCLREDFKPLQLTDPWRNGRLYIRHKQDLLAAIELHSSILTTTTVKHH